MNRRMIIISVSSVLALIGAALITWSLWGFMKPMATVVAPPASVTPASVVKQMASLEKRMTQLEKRAIVKTDPAPAPAPCCTPCCTPPLTPSAVPAPTSAPAVSVPVVIVGQPQTYYNSWGWWLVDPNGSFHCPPVSNPTSWTGGMKILVQRPNSPPYETWAPACYR